MNKPLAAAVLLSLCAATLPSACAAPLEEAPGGEKAEPRPDKGHSVIYTRGGCRIEEDWDGPSHSTKVLCQQGARGLPDQQDNPRGDREKSCPPDC